jgi:3-oxoacyl-[acyl-carrier-protein] synthase II
MGRVPQPPRVAITGLGAITPSGSDAHSTWEAISSGRSGVTTVGAEWAADLPVRIAGQVAPGFEQKLAVREVRRMDRAEQLALLAGREAWASAGSPDAERDRIAVVVGTAIGGLTTTIDQQHILENAGPRRVSPHTVTMMMANGAAAWLSIDINARGGARTPVSACASGSEALLMAREMILSGSADVVLAGGTDACITGLTLGSLAQTRALSRREGDPAAASRPFDQARDGFVLGEGAALLVLEREDHARARGAVIHAFLAGAALTSDAYDIVAADPDNQQRTIELALRSAGLAAGDIGLVHAHATSTPLGDLNESRAILGAIGPHPQVTSTKSMTGHLLGASGALGALVTVFALERRTVPPTINLDELDPEIELDVVANTARATTAEAAVVNSFGFGGHNASLVLTRA